MVEFSDKKNSKWEPICLRVQILKRRIKGFTAQPLATSSYEKKHVFKYSYYQVHQPTLSAIACKVSRMGGIHCMCSGMYFSRFLSHFH